MRPVHANKKGRRYHYYVSPTLVEGSVETGATGWRIPAHEIERALSEAIVARLGQPDFVSQATEIHADPYAVARVIDRLDKFVGCIFKKGLYFEVVRERNILLWY